MRFSTTVTCTPASAAGGIPGIPGLPGGPAEPTPPEVGACHALTWSELGAAADPDEPVACDGRHTSRTFLVPVAPARVDLTSPDAVGRWASGVCGPAWRRAISPDYSRRLMSAYDGYAIFVPTAAQQRDGARWVRCDIVLFGGRKALAPLPRRVRTPALRSATPPDAEARCYTAGRSLYVTTCARPHGYRAKAVFAMKGRAYPAERAFQRAAGRRCARASDVRRWVFLRPSAQEWRAGFRYVTCLDVTRR